MAAQATVVQLYDKLKVLGGVPVAADLRWTTLVETNREDGNDSLALSLALNAAGASLVTKWTVATVHHADGAVVEYPIVSRVRSTGKNIVAATGGTVQSYLSTLYSTVKVSVTDAPYILGGTLTSLTGWPSWLTFSGLGFVGSYTLDIAVGDSFGALITKLMAAFNAVTSPGTAPVVGRFVPTMSGGEITGYVYTIYGTGFTTFPAGTVHLLEPDKNIASLDEKVDVTNPDVPDTSYQLTVGDVYRNQPTRFPYDNLLPYQTARLESRRLGIDVTTRIVSVVTDHSVGTLTTLELGTPVRRADQVAAVVALVTAATAATVEALPPPQVVLDVQPYSITSSTVVLRVKAATPASAQTVTLAYTQQPSGLAVSPSSGISISATTDLSTTGHADITITRDAFGDLPGVLSFVGSAPGHLDGTAQASIETVSNLASATKVLRFTMDGLIPLSIFSSLVANADTSVQSSSGASVEQYQMALPLPPDVTLVEHRAWLSGYAQSAILRDDGTVVGSGVTAGGGAGAEYYEALSEVAGSTRRYSVLISFNGGSVSSDRKAKYVVISYTSPSLQNTY